MHHTYIFEIIFILLGIALIVAIAKYPSTLLEIIKFPFKVVARTIIEPIYAVVAVVLLISGFVKRFFFMDSRKNSRTKRKSNRNFGV